MKLYDYIVVGSGCSGAIAAQRLVEEGVEVTMLDVGVKNNKRVKIPNKDFVALRRTDPMQYRYFIGDKAEGVSWGKVGTAAQLTPPRKYIMRLVNSYIPVQSSSFSNFESLAYGGMGAGWSLQAWEYSKDDLEAAGLDYSKIKKAYNILAKTIGVNASANDATRNITGNFDNYGQPANMDRNNKYLYKWYKLNKDGLNKKGVTMGRTPLALLTKNQDGRKQYSYTGMDFYGDSGKSAWRPTITVDQLKNKTNFNYIDGYLVLRFKENKDHIEVHCLRVADNKPTVFKCRKLILGSGALGSARIVLRSFNRQREVKLPFLSNPYTYIPCLQPKMFGKEVEPKKLSFSQLSIFLDKDRLGAKASMGSLHSYQSLLLFRIIKQVPFNFVDARILMRYLSSGIIVLAVYHPDGQTKNKYVKLVDDTKSISGDKLKIEYSLSDAEEKDFKSRENRLKKAMRKMKAYPLTSINPGHGSAIHYGGTLPFSDDEKPYTLSREGRLHMTKNVYVADSSGFKYLPSQGLTFSIMANAYVVAEEALNAG